MKLTIVIPAYNEEAAIGSIIERTLAARDTIIRDSPVDEVEIVVVSDGSTDRTADIAAGHDGVRVVVFERNRGYGAAIKKGFETGTGDLVGFLDADGTCDPTFFATLCTALAEENAAVALGSRMGPDSRMPRVRRLGNRIYAMILSALSNRIVTDTASGMRVIRRDVLRELYPLPDGLHFTPAMSARALMDDRLTIVERPMPYHERVGESKLNVVTDGVRFLRTIFEMTLMWRPTRLFLSASVACLVVMTLLALYPIEMWIRSGRLEEDMIYRLLFCWLMGAMSVTLLSAAVVSDHLHRLIDDRPHRRTFTSNLLDALYSVRGCMVASVLALPLLLWLVGRGVWTWTTDGYVEEHWSRVVLAGLIGFGTAQLAVTVSIVNLLRFHAARRSRHAAGHTAAPIRSAEMSVRAMNPARPAIVMNPRDRQPILTADAINTATVRERPSHTPAVMERSPFPPAQRAAGFSPRGAAVTDERPDLDSMKRDADESPAADSNRHYAEWTRPQRPITESDP